MSAEEFKKQLEAISLEYRQDLPARLDEIETLWQSLAGGNTGPERLPDLQRALHTIAGSARTFGVAGVSEAASAAETFVERFSKRRKMPAPAQQAKFARLLHALRQAAG